MESRVWSCAQRKPIIAAMDERKRLTAMVKAAG